MIKDISLWIWQLPQNVIGWFMTFFAESKTIIYMNDGTMYPVYLHKLNPKTWGEAVTLGEYIFMDSQYYLMFNQDLPVWLNTANHEYGHTKQSRMLGWFYLFVIGIPSIIHAAIHNHTCRGKEYEHFYTERWADKLGGVDGKTDF